MTSPIGWAATLEAGTELGLGPLAAVRLALAVSEATAASYRRLVTLARRASTVEATIRDERGCSLVLPPGLTDYEATRPGPAGSIDHVIAVTNRPASELSEQARSMLSEAVAAGTPGDRLLGLTVQALEQQGAQLAAHEEERHKFQAELDETNLGILAVHTELETANQRIADLLAMLSHDIRQPLGVISGYSSVLVEEWDDLDDAARRRDLDRISTAATATSALVDEMLTLTQLDTNRLPTHPTAINAAHAVSDTVTLVSVPSSDTIMVHPVPDTTIFVDPRHFQQILGNLLSNAVKYGAPPVELSVGTTTDAVTISVRDHGEGVPAEFLPHMFDRYSRAATATARQQKGTGLGLYIVRQLTEANGGAISHHHPPDGGSCFTVTFPKRAA